MRFAVVPFPWRYIKIALIAFLVILFLRWIDKDDQETVDTRNRVYSRHLVSVHVKERAGAWPYGMEPLFTHLRPSTSASADPRTRWFHVELLADQAQALVDRLEHSSDVEDVFIAPTYSLPSAGATDDSCPIKT